MSILFRAIAILSVFVSSSATVSDCSKGLSLFKLTSMSFSPDPTVPGENSTLLLSMTVPEEITGGTVTYSTTYNFIPFAPTTEPLCDVTVACPIQVGELSTVSTYPMDTTTTGSLAITIRWKDTTNRELLCVQIKTTLGH